MGADTAGADSPAVATWYSRGWNRWWLVRSISVTSTGARASVRTASSPPNPQPMTTTWGSDMATVSQAHENVHHRPTGADPMRLHLLALALALGAALAACETMSEDQCRKASGADWFERGRADGRNGDPESHLEAHRKACAKSGVVPDERRWRQGWFAPGLWG